ncbi:MAG: hypothetical protein Q9182_007587, partial [Xanthomendoza sp. 2 TL-2023]
VTVNDYVAAFGDEIAAGNFTQRFDHDETNFSVPINVAEPWTKAMQRTQSDAHEVMEPQFELLLPCQGDNSIAQVLDEYFATEEKEKIECASAECGTRKTTKRYEKAIERGPDMLCTLFNRFIRVNGRYRKSMSDVAFGEILDLSRFVKNREILRYRLRAAIHHRGTKERGHYITVARTPGGQWVRHDNQEVSTVSLEEVLRPADGFTPYLLFWQKEKPKSRKRPSPVEHEKEQRDESSKRHKPSSIWPSQWLYGRASSAQKPQPTSEALSKRQAEQPNLNDDAQKLEQLIQRAAYTHKRLVDCTNYMTVGLDSALKTLATISPLMQELQSKQHYRAHATRFLAGEDRARRSRLDAMRQIERNERLLQLVQVDEGHDGGRSNTAVGSFLHGFEAARRQQQQQLRVWLDRELRPDSTEGEGQDCPVS